MRRENGQVVGIVDRVAVLKAIAGEGGLTRFRHRAPVAAPTLTHLPWWRGRPVKVALVAA